MSLKTWDEEDCRTWDIDEGIVGAVHILRSNGVETCQSCEGGEGHSYPEPTIEFHGDGGAGWKALGICLDYGLPVLNLHRTWGMNGDVPTGPVWALVFRKQVPLRPA